ncbi:hypothetical protein [Bosea sp. 117]|uniref:hypothetical protein n=1 Tax=Bosea sp. 117 TaxID=1125973 RepID=UPI000494424C|nr:hypothetical protein [Bosea sp. 117]
MTTTAATRKLLTFVAVAMGLIGLLALAGVAERALTERVGSSGGCPLKPGLHVGPLSGASVTHCDGGDPDTGEVASGTLARAPFAVIQYLGHPSAEGVLLWLEGPDGERLPLHPKDATIGWRRAVVAVPEGWASFRVVARDESTAFKGWIGLGEVRRAFLPFDASALARLLFWLVVAHLALAAWYAAARRRWPSEDGALLLPLIVGAGAYGAVIAWFLHPWLGMAVSLALMAGTLAMAVQALPQDALADASRAVAPVSAFTLFVLVMGLYPFADQIYLAAGDRWLWLPGDNVLQLLLADQLRRGALAIPMVWDWHASDRPPLQSGVYLLWGVSDRALYQVVSSLAQALILLPLGALLRQMMPQRLVWMGLAAFGASSLALLHTLYVWPKLFSATFLLIVFIETFAPIEGRAKRHALIMGGAAAFALLCHGGAIFALAILVPFYLWTRRRDVFGETARTVPTMMNMLLSALIAFLAMLPWLLFQRLIDPPGDRLAKWHLAGLIEVNEGIGLVEAMRAAYARLGFDAWLAGRLENLRMVYGGLASFLPDLAAGRFANPDILLHRSFYETLYSLWFIAPAGLAAFLILAARGGLPPRAAPLFVTGNAILLLWALAMFVPGSAVIHQGTFFPWVALFAAAIGCLAALHPALLAAALAGNVTLMALFYLPEKAAAASPQLHAAAAFAAFLAFAAACHRGVREPEAPLHM